jgi:hypothetical protein
MMNKLRFPVNITVWPHDEVGRNKLAKPLLTKFSVTSVVRGRLTAVCIKCVN